MDKNPSIIDLLDRLNIDNRGWFVKDYWEGDLCAVGISSKVYEERLAYVSTYGKTDGSYYCECEVDNNRNSLGYDVVYERDDIPFDELNIVLEQHLDRSGFRTLQ